MRRMVRALLLLSLWHAPIPWVHAHDLAGPSVDHVASLHRHVDAFHARDIEHGEFHLDLHAHLVLPWSHDRQPLHGPGGPELPDSDDSDFVLEMGGGAAGSTLKALGRPIDPNFDPLRMAGDLATRGPSAWSAAPGVSRSQGRHFFETFGRSVSVGDLICVRVC
ncbi:MAG TPA: hypothetical protein VL475_13515 [Planctomycetaceae bacterium]|nr:hypothetical protein [Planctomycetaceae bacterium]